MEVSFPAPRPSVVHRVWDPLPFVLVHVALLGVLWTGVTAGSLALFAALYVVRMWGLTGAHHRYFAHRTFKTSRAFQFVLALVRGDITGDVCALSGSSKDHFRVTTRHDVEAQASSK